MTLFMPPVQLEDALRSVTRSSLSGADVVAEPPASQLDIRTVFDRLKIAHGTVTAAARAVGINRATWYRLYNGTHALPSAASAVKLGLAYEPIRAERRALNRRRANDRRSAMVSRNGTLKFKGRVKDPSDKIRERKIDFSRYFTPSTRLAILSACEAGNYAQAAHAFTIRGVWDDYEAQGTQIIDVEILTWE